MPTKKPMALEYRIGELKITDEHLIFEGEIPYYAEHKFLVEFRESAVFIYVAQGNDHRFVCNLFNLPEKRLVGGGSVYLNANRRLVIDDYSGSYKAIPKESAERFASLIVNELTKKGIAITGIYANPDERHLNPFWKRLKTNEKAELA